MINSQPAIKRALDIIDQESFEKQDLYPETSVVKDIVTGFVLTLRNQFLKNPV